MRDNESIRVKAANAVTALADLNATLTASYQNDVHVLRETVELQGKELARLNHGIGEQDKELSVLREANHSLARNCAEESNRASALQSELNSASSELKIKSEHEVGLKQLIVDIRREAGEAKEQLAKAETKNRELSAEFAKASEALAKYDGQSEFHTWTNGDFAKQIAAVREERDALRKANAAHKKQINQYEDEIGRLKKDYCDGQDDIRSMQNDIFRLERELRDEIAKRLRPDENSQLFRKTNDSQGEHIAHLTKDLAQVKSSLVEASKANAEYVANADRATTRANEAASENARLRELLNNEASSRTALLKELDACKKELAELTANHERLLNEVAGLKEQLDVLSKSRDGYIEDVKRYSAQYSEAAANIVQAHNEWDKAAGERDRQLKELALCKLELARIKDELKRAKTPLNEEDYKDWERNDFLAQIVALMEENGKLRIMNGSARIAQLELQFELFKKEYPAAKDEIDSLKGIVEILEGKLETYEGVSDD